MKVAWSSSFSLFFLNVGAFLNYKRKLKTSYPFLLFPCVARYINDSSDCSSDLRNSRGEPVPALFFCGQLFNPCFSQCVELGSAAGIGHPPLGPDPAALLDPVDRGVE